MALLAGVLGERGAGVHVNLYARTRDVVAAGVAAAATHQARGGLIAFVSDRDGAEALYLMRGGRLARCGGGPVSCLRSRTRHGRRTGDGWRSTPGPHEFERHHLDRRRTGRD